jgi:hypothetical protein
VPFWMWKRDMRVQKSKQNQRDNVREISRTKPPVSDVEKYITAELLPSLRELATNPDAPAMARSAVARTILEAEGVLGRHSRDPHNRHAEKPLGECSLVDRHPRKQQIRTVQSFIALYE